MRRITFALLFGVVGLGISAASAGQRPVRAPRPAAPICRECTMPPMAVFSAGLGGPALPSTGHVPRPLPLPENAIPLEAAAPDPAIVALVRKHLGQLGEEAQRIWVEELTGLPVEIARQLLLAREQSGGEDIFDPLRTLEPVGPPVQSEPTPPHPIPRQLDGEQGDAHAKSVALLRRAETLILQNIANARTPAYKRILPFTTNSGDPGEGLVSLVTRRVRTQGPIHQTGRQLDFALDGPGYFQIRSNGTTALTRRGLFHLDEHGMIVTTINGRRWQLAPRLVVPPGAGAIAIAEDGTVTCQQPPGRATRTLGRIQLAIINDASDLEALGGGAWRVPEGTASLRYGWAGEAGFAQVHSGAVEGSNVKLSNALESLDQVRQQIRALTGGEGISQSLPTPPDRMANRGIDEPRELASPRRKSGGMGRARGPIAEP